MRTTDDKKDNIIRIRLNDTLNKHVQKMSSIKNITISEYIRSLITKDMRNR